MSRSTYLGGGGHQKEKKSAGSEAGSLRVNVPYPTWEPVQPVPPLSPLPIPAPFFPRPPPPPLPLSPPRRPTRWSRRRAQRSSDGPLRSSSYRIDVASRRRSRRFRRRRRRRHAIVVIAPVGCATPGRGGRRRRVHPPYADSVDVGHFRRSRTTTTTRRKATTATTTSSSDAVGRRRRRRRRRGYGAACRGMRWTATKVDISTPWY